jgi:DNA replication protein DnaC
VACDVCNDTTWKTIDADGVSRVARCDCWLERAARSRFAAANIPTRYQHCTLDNFEAYNDSLKRAVKYARTVVADFPVNSAGRDRGLLLIGLPGVGKTHIAVAILKECIRKGGTGRFFTTVDLMAALRSTYSGNDALTESAVLKDVSEADLVVLDELGRERATEWRDEILHLVINQRYSHRRPTILTTNFDVSDIDDPDALQVRVGMRVYSRLNEMCELMHLDAADYRERPTNAGTDDLLSMWKMRKKSPLPSPRASGRQARAQLRAGERGDGKADLKWSGGRAGSQ